MKTLLLVLLTLASCSLSMAQKIHFNLTYTDSIPEERETSSEGNESYTPGYTGIMNPRWFEHVSMRLTKADPSHLEGAEGAMRGGDLGSMGFRIETNKLPTQDLFMLRTNNGWYPIEKVKQRGNTLHLRFDWAYRPKPMPVDLQILRKADSLLVDESAWNPEDDRSCEDDFENMRFSLYCLLQGASLSVTEDFNHRGASLNAVRVGIAELRPDREYEHRLMDFNNEEDFETIKVLLANCIDTLEKSLDE